MSVIHNTQHPESTLKNKINYIFYYAVYDSVAIVESLTGQFGTNGNYSYLVTKVMYGGKRKFHVSNLLYDICDGLWEFWWQH